MGSFSLSHYFGLCSVYSRDNLSWGSPLHLPHSCRHSFCCILLLTTSGASLLLPLPYLSLYWSLAVVGRRGGVVIKEPDWSVNSAQCCMKCTRPSDGPNRASYCKQHAHLDSNKPRGRKRRKLAQIKEGSIFVIVCVGRRVCVPKYIFIYIVIDTCYKYK